MFKNYFKIAWRIITKNKFYTLINILSLSLGICGCIVIWLVVSYELSFDRFHPDKERIYRVGSKMKNSDWYDHDVVPPAPDAFRKEIAGLDAVTSIFPYVGDAKIIVPNKGKSDGQYTAILEGTDGMSVAVITDPDWFSIFKYEWLAGSPRGSLHDPFKVVLSERRAREYFGSIPIEKIIGREVIYNDSLRVNVSGIVRDWNKNTDFPYTDFISYSTIESSFLKNKRHLQNWQLIKGGGSYFWPMCFVKLSKAVKEERVNAQLKALVTKYIKMDSTNTFAMQLQPLTDIHFNGNYNNLSRTAHLPTLYALTAISMFILLLAVVNFINLATALSFRRAKEIGVRKVLGSGRASLILQFLIEAGVLTLFSVTLACLSVKPFLSFFRNYIPNGVRFDPFNPSTFVFLFLITVFTSLLAGFYPAKVLAGYLPVLSLKGASLQKGGEKWWLRKCLIVFQFFISLIFIIVTLVIGDQIQFMLKTDYGFKSNAIITLVPDWTDTTGKIKILAERIRQMPGIERIVIQGMVPIGWAEMSASVIYKGKNEIEQSVITDWGNEDFIPFYQMRIVAGRNLRHSDSLVEWVINETLARRLGFNYPRDALGKFLYWNNRPFPVVGVVADFHQRSFRDPIKPLMIGNETRIENSLGIKLASRGNQLSNTKQTLSSIEYIFKEIYPKKPFYYLFMDESIAAMYESEQKTASLVRTAMILAIIISCMGLFGLALFTAARRTKEIGIRKTLGASVVNIVGLLSKDFVFLVLLALLIATPLAWWFMQKWLQDFAYRININFWVFLQAGLGAVLITLLTVSYQAVKAAIAKPVKSLRTE